MESLSKTLQPYKSVIGSVASFVTIGQFFSGVFICYDIWKNKSTRGKSSLPFVGGVVMGILVLKYALILQDKAMFQVNVAAILLNTLYMICFGIYSSSRSEELYKQIVYSVGLLGAIFAYLSVEQPALIEFRYGLLVTVLALLLLGSPLIEVKEIVANKDASGIPFPLVFMGAWVSFLWLLYGIILMNDFMVVQNIIGLVLCIVQLYLSFIYPGNTTGREKKKKQQ